MFVLPEPAKGFLGEKTQGSKIHPQAETMARESGGAGPQEERPERKAGWIDSDRRECPGGWGGWRVAPSLSTPSPAVVLPLQGLGP